MGIDGTDQVMHIKYSYSNIQTSFDGFLKVKSLLCVQVKRIYLFFSKTFSRFRWLRIRNSCYFCKIHIYFLS